MPRWTDQAAGVPELPTLEDLLGRPSWQGEAACSGKDVKPFFSGTSADIDRATAVCHTCPVQAPCLQYAMADPDLEGVWAATTAKERREIRRHW